MDKKRISSAALALAVTASVGASALATENANLPVAGIEISGDRVVNDGVVTETPEQGTIVITPDGSAVDSGFGVDDSFGIDAGFGVEAEVIPEFYNGVVSINGEDITSVDFAYSKPGDWQEYHRVKNVSELPGAPAGYIPMRLLCQAAGGSATWFGTEGFSSFYINDTLIYTNYTTGEVSVMDENYDMIVREDLDFYFCNGVTYLPVSFINTLPRITVYSYTFDGQEIFDIEIEPEGTPLDQLTSEVYNSSEAPGSMTLDKDTLQMLTDVDFSVYFEEFSGLMAAMSAQSNVTVIGKYAEGVDKDAAKAALQKIQQYMIDCNTFYADPLALAKAGKIVESEDGKYAMLIISRDNESAIVTFNVGVTLLDQDNNGIMPR